MWDNYYDYIAIITKGKTHGIKNLLYNSIVILLKASKDTEPLSFLEIFYSYISSSHSYWFYEISVFATISTIYFNVFYLKKSLFLINYGICVHNITITSNAHPFIYNVIPFVELSNCNPKISVVNCNN